MSTKKDAKKQDTAQARTVSMLDGQTDAGRPKHLGRDGSTRTQKPRLVATKNPWETLGQKHWHKLSGLSVKAETYKGEIAWTVWDGVEQMCRFENAVSAFKFVEMSVK